MDWILIAWVLLGLVFDILWGLILLRSLHKQEPKPKRLKKIFWTMTVFGLCLGVIGIFDKVAILCVMFGLIIGALLLGLFLKIKGVL